MADKPPAKADDGKLLPDVPSLSGGGGTLRLVGVGLAVCALLGALGTVVYLRSFARSRRRLAFRHRAAVTGPVV